MVQAWTSEYMPPYLCQARLWMKVATPPPRVILHSYLSVHNASAMFQLPLRNPAQNQGETISVNLAQSRHNECNGYFWWCYVRWGHNIVALSCCVHLCVLFFSPTLKLQLLYITAALVVLTSLIFASLLLNQHPLVTRPRAITKLHFDLLYLWRWVSFT